MILGRATRSRHGRGFLNGQFSRRWGNIFVPSGIYIDEWDIENNGLSNTVTTINALACSSFSFNVNGANGNVSNFTWTNLDNGSSITYAPSFNFGGNPYQSYSWVYINDNNIPFVSSGANFATIAWNQSSGPGGSAVLGTNVTGSFTWIGMPLLPVYFAGATPDPPAQGSWRMRKGVWQFVFSGSAGTGELGVYAWRKFGWRTDQHVNQVTWQLNQDTFQLNNPTSMNIDCRACQFWYADLPSWIPTNGDPWNLTVTATRLSG